MICVKFAILLLLTCHVTLARRHARTQHDDSASVAHQAQTSTCGRNQFTCRTGRCIPDTWQCDRDRDCNSYSSSGTFTEDNSDEVNCPNCTDVYVACYNTPRPTMNSISQHERDSNDQEERLSIWSTIDLKDLCVDYRALATCQMQNILSISPECAALPKYKRDIETQRSYSAIYFFLCNESRVNDLDRVQECLFSFDNLFDIYSSCIQKNYARASCSPENMVNCAKDETREKCEEKGGDIANLAVKLTEEIGSFLVQQRYYMLRCPSEWPNAGPPQVTDWLNLFK